MASSEISNPLRAALADLAAWLRATEVKGVVIGGVAASLLGRPRLTRDIDALVLLDEERWPEFLDAGSRFGFAPRRPDALAFARDVRVLVVRHVKTHVDADIVLGALPFEKDIVSRGALFDLDGTAVPLASPEDLVVMKAVAQRPRDLIDIEALLDAHPDLDLTHVRRWLREFATALDRPETLSEFERLVRSRRSARGKTP